MSDDELWRIERDFWLKHREHFHEHASGDCVLAFPEPTGLMDKTTALSALSGAPRWSDVVLEERCLVRPADDVVVLGYRVTAERPGERTYEALCTTTYVRRDRRWLLVQHQQTPVR